MLIKLMYHVQLILSKHYRDFSGLFARLAFSCPGWPEGRSYQGEATRRVSAANLYYDAARSLKAALVADKPFLSVAANLPV